MIHTSRRNSCRPLLAAAAALSCLAAHASAEVVVFRFTGAVSQIIDNAGGPRTLGPIAIGNTFTGTFQYEINQTPTFSNSNFRRYQGACNSWRITISGLDFYSTSAEPGVLGVSSYPGQSEGISVGTWDISVPAGWSIPQNSPSDSYLVILQNNPPTSPATIQSLNPPSTLNLAQWSSERGLSMDFFNGITFPGGQYPDRTIIRGTIQTITQLPSITVTTNPTVATLPSSVTVSAGQTATIPMSVSGIGTIPPTFQWRRNGSVITPGGRVQVAPTGALTISAATSTDMGVYDCIVNYGCGTIILGPVALGVSTLPPPPACPADFDRNGTLAAQDIFDFLNAWFAGCP